MNKLIVTRAFVAWTHGWNQALHQAIEGKVMVEYEAMFPNGTDNPEGMLSQMRAFYYARMMNTASLLIGVSAAALAAIAVVVSVVALAHA